MGGCGSPFFCLPLCLPVGEVGVMVVVWEVRAMVVGVGAGGTRHSEGAG